jgi:signal transduction histidine kinase
LLEESYIDLGIAIYSIITAIIFTIMYRKRGILFLWILAAIINAIASIIFYLRHYDANYRIIGNIFYFLAAIVFCYSVYQIYSEMFIKTKKNGIKSKEASKNLIFFMTFSLTLIDYYQIALCIFIILIIAMLLRINLKKTSISHSFMLITMIAAFFTLVFSILYNQNIAGAWEMAYILKIIFITSILATGLSAPIEDKINTSENKYFEAFNRAEFYKDLFAHDISNILQNVQSSMDLFPFYLENSDQVEETHNLVDIVKNQVNRGATLISNIRKLSEIEELEILLEPTSVCEVIKNTIEYLKKTYEDKEIEIQIDSTNDKYFVKANELLFNVFENILVNSIKYNNNPNIEILIKVSQVQNNSIDFIKLEFTDNGIGIPDSMKDKVFQRAFIKDKTVSGMGLGLSLVKKIIEKYNAQIWVEDKIKGDFAKGSNFIIIIPEVN